MVGRDELRKETRGERKCHDDFGADSIEELIMTEDTTSSKHKVGAVKDVLTKLDDRMKACDQAQEK